MKFVSGLLPSGIHFTSILKSTQGNVPIAATNVVSSSPSSMLFSATIGSTRERSHSCVTHAGGHLLTSPLSGGTPQYTIRIHRGSLSLLLWTARPRVMKGIRLNNLTKNMHRPSFRINCCLLQKITIFTTWPQSKAVYLLCMRIVLQIQPASQTILWCPRMLCWPPPSASLAS